jgi:hypothetical protein
MFFWYCIGFALVAYTFNMANKNLAGKRGSAPGKKTYNQALKDWEAFQEKHPPKKG